MPTPSDTVLPSVLPISVITTCYGRNQHLYNLLASLEAGSWQPAEVILVNDDADSDMLASFDLNIVQIATNIANPSKIATETDDALPKIDLPKFDIGLNRNKGAKAASFETLIFLDVDCIVARGFIAGLTAQLTAHPHALLMGQPRYLTRPLTTAESVKLRQSTPSDAWLSALSILNPYRHNLIKQDANKDDKKDDKKDDITTAIKSDRTVKAIPIIKKTADYGAFWSLCFAITKTQFWHIGGFDTQFVGYGAEDTDFAFSARKLGIDFYLTADVVYHQQHGVYRPPLNHLASIVVNANHFFNKWQHWPMAGWLQSFDEMGLIKWTNEQNTPITLQRQPTDSELIAAHCPNAAYV